MVNIKIRNAVGNPIIHHIAAIVNGFIMAAPSTWADAHSSICTKETLDLSYAKNKEFQKIVIDSVRRSGHRGTSCLNWWMNYVCWHCAIFESPEEFLNPLKRYGKDVTGVVRWLNSAFEGDDSFLVTSPEIKGATTLHTLILQLWERIGFNKKIELRDKRALFVGYYIGLDDRGPQFDAAKDEYMMLPEVNRCFARSWTSCSSTMIEAFKANDMEKCKRLAGSAAMSRAYEFAGLSPTISNKFLQYAIDHNFIITHDLQMRTNTDFEDKTELIDHIRTMSGICRIEQKILDATGFSADDAEKNKFQDRLWDYNLLQDWEGFRAALPTSWRI